MATGKKGKKNKGKTLALTDFLQETPGPVTTLPIRKSQNWADEVEDSYDGFESRSKSANLVLPTAPKASWDYEDISDKVPKEPPYIAYLSNLPYDLEEDEIADFFRNMNILNMRIPKDERPGEMPKLKGYGYVEFKDRESLMNALVIPDTTLKSRRIRIDIPANTQNDRRRGGRLDMGRDRSDRGELGDWRSGPRIESADERRGGGFSRDNRDGFTRDSNRDAGTDDRPNAWRDGDRSNRDSERGFSRSDRFHDSDRRGMDRDDNRRGFNDRDGDRRGFSDSNRRGYGDRERDRGFDDRRSNFSNRRFEDRENDFSRSNREDFSRSNREEDSRSSEPRQRPKLVLAPRTKPIETESEKPNAVPSASIFGNAKPVDTSMREREIEEKLAKGGEEKKDDEGRRNDRERPRISRKADTESPNTNRPNSQTRKDSISEEEKKGSGPRNDSHKPTEIIEKQKSEPKPKKEEKREKQDRGMPKVAEPEAPNFAANNKFAFLQEEDNSD